ncbi:FAD/NAD-binding domain-containing protein [Sanghuangporus baumii]|uniref:FAD/NAD-binding domain-containing protein n=1 Tax=Sanghuangporus baumii TaxID=108892 RepID=A0A9Q5I1N2_SANBA|nr:FAD/NAD-binding domain-containing protein [Sanghuangporus baumii]
MSESGLKICIVGGGAAGLAVAKVFKETEQSKSGLWTVRVFEEREDIGGTWLSAPATDKNIPPPTPMYDSIITNLPHPIMCYQSYWFPPSTPLFPKAGVVQDYLRAYAKEFDLMPHVNLSTSITSAVWTGNKWNITARGTSTSNGPEVTLEFDKLIVANGHYHVPFFPSLPGLDSWRSKDRVTHSAWYRHPIPVGDKVLVVGGGYSGIDIAEEMSTACKTLIHAAPHSVAVSHGNIVVHDSRAARLSELGADANPESERVVYFEDGSTESGIDHIFLATGYSLSFPFFKPPQLLVAPPSEPIHPSSPSDPLPEHLHNSEHHVFPLARFLFPISQDFPPESAAFVGLPVRVAPLPLFEAQARAIVKVFSDQSALDVPTEIQSIHERLASIRSNPDIIPPEPNSNEDSIIAHYWHTFKGREQFIYRDALHAFSGLTGDEWKVPEWVMESYENMVEMRKLWKEIVEKGEDEKWCKGVGEKGGEEGKEEWVEVMRRLLGMVRERKEADGLADKLNGPVPEVEPEKVV